MSQSKVIRRHIPCPSCPSSDAYCEYDDGHGYCFSCNYYKPSDSPDLEEYTYEYLPYRGIDRETFQFFDAKTKVGLDGKPVSIGFRYPNGAYKIRTLDKKGFYTQGEIGKVGLYGRDKFDGYPRKSIIITEGELDALSYYQTLRSVVVSVKSAATAASDVGMERPWVNEYERIYLAFDGDEAGRRAAQAVAKLFDPNKVYDIRFTGAKKDANDYVKSGLRDELAQLYYNARRYLPESIVSSLPEFEKIIHEIPKSGTAYPWPTLNYMTYGIRTGESVLFTAQEGVGKTEVMHAILHNILKETKDAIGCIFLEEPKKRLLQAVAGIDLQRPVHLPDAGVTDAETFDAVCRVVGEDDRLHLYSHFGSDDPEVILDTIRFLVTARLCRFVLLDHITMVVSGRSGEDERRALDYLSTRLEMMVKELDFALLLVSHVNDDGLTRGSRNISKIADVRIDLDRDIKAVDPIIRRCLHLTISKNRFCGRTGPAGVLLFDPEKYILTEENDYGSVQRAVIDDSWPQAQRLAA